MAASHSTTVPCQSPLPAANTRPSGDHATDLIASSCVPYFRTSVPVATSQQAHRAIHAAGDQLLAVAAEHQCHDPPFVALAQTMRLARLEIDKRDLSVIPADGQLLAVRSERQGRDALVEGFLLSVRHRQRQWLAGGRVPQSRQLLLFATGCRPPPQAAARGRGGRRAPAPRSSSPSRCRPARPGAARRPVARHEEGGRPAGAGPARTNDRIMPPERGDGTIGRLRHLSANHAGGGRSPHCTGCSPRGYTGAIGVCSTTPPNIPRGRAEIPARKSTPARGFFAGRPPARGAGSSG